MSKLSKFEAEISGLARYNHSTVPPGHNDPRKPPCRGLTRGCIPQRGKVAWRVRRACRDGAE